MGSNKVEIQTIHINLLKSYFYNVKYDIMISDNVSEFHILIISDMLSDCQVNIKNYIFKEILQVSKEIKDSTTELSREERNGRCILASARKLFIEHHGTDGVNMHRIAKAAGVGQATLYRRYTVIGDICIEIVNEECQPMFDELNEYLNTNSENHPLDKLYYVIERFAIFLEEKTPWLCAVSRTILGYHPMQMPLYQWMRDTCKTLLSEADQQGELSDVDIPYTVEVLLSALHDFDFHLQDHDFTTKQIVQGLHRIFIKGLKK
jgi:AcrR family transcriptional regulator